MRGWGSRAASQGAARTATAVDPESKRVKYARLNLEADRELASNATRRNAVVGRASTLVGAASIGASVSAASTGLLNLLAAIAFLAAAVLGVTALWPRAGDGLNLGALFDRSWSTSSEEIELSLLQVKLKALDERPLFDLANIVRWGFVALTAAILLLAVGAGLTATKGDPVPDKTPPPEPNQQSGPSREPDPALLQREVRESGGGKPSALPPSRPARSQ